MKKTISLLLVLIIALNLVACGGSKDISQMVGDYELVKMTDDGKTYDQKELKTIESLGLEISFKITKDKKAIMNLMGQKTNFKIDADDQVFINGKSKVYYTYEDGTLTMDNKEKSKSKKTTLVFKKK